MTPLSAFLLGPLVAFTLISVAVAAAVIVLGGSNRNVVQWTVNAAVGCIGTLLLWTALP